MSKETVQDRDKRLLETFKKKRNISKSRLDRALKNQWPNDADWMRMSGGDPDISGDRKKAPNLQGQTVIDWVKSIEWWDGVIDKMASFTYDKLGRRKVKK